MNCPNCGAPIKFYDLKPNCRKCGVNITYFTQEQELIRDAKRTELEFGSARIFGAKLKSAYIGDFLAIARIVTTLLTVGALFIPFATFIIKLPAAEAKMTVSALGIYGLYSDGILTLMPNLLKSTLFSGSVRTEVIVIAGFLLVVFIVLAIFALFFVLFLKQKKLSRVTAVISFIAVAFDIAAFILTLSLKSGFSGKEFLSASVGVGAFAAAAVLLANGVINLIISKREPVLKVREHDYDRKELLKKVRAGEIDLDSLPLPVFESEEEKQQRLNALEQALKKEEEGKE